MDKAQQHLKETLDNFNTSVFSWAQTPGDYAAWISWGFGANYLLNAALPVFSDELKPNNLLKTQLLFELALQPIIASHYFHSDPSQSDLWENLEPAFGTIQTNIQRFMFGTDNRESKPLHMNLLKQYLYCLQQNSEEDRYHLLLLYCQLLEYRWIECCADKHLLEWTALAFPCRSYDDMLKVRRFKNDELVLKTINPTNTITLCQIINQALMFSDILCNISYNSLQNEAKQSWYSVILSKLLPAEEELSTILVGNNPNS